MGHNRILIDKDDWTPFRNEIFKEGLLSRLRGRHTAGLYFYLYDHAYHFHSHDVSTTLSQLAAETGRDERVLKRSLRELELRGLICKADEGVSHSRTSTPRWTVPLARRVALEEGNWTPVPRVLILEYWRLFPNAVLLPLLLYHQHMSWLNDCWVGVTTLGCLLRWSKTRVRDALRKMSLDDEWRRVTKGLPRPLMLKTVKGKQGKRSRHFNVLAMAYTEQEKKSQRTVSLAPEFQDL